MNPVTYICLDCGRFRKTEGWTMPELVYVRRRISAHSDFEMEVEHLHSFGEGLLLLKLSST